MMMMISTQLIRNETQKDAKNSSTQMFEPNETERCKWERSKGNMQTL